MTDQQEMAVGAVSAALEQFGAALVACHRAGLKPAEALRAAGLEIPAWAGPLVNRLESTFAEALPADPS